MSRGQLMTGLLHGSSRLGAGVIAVVALAACAAPGGSGEGDGDTGAITDAISLLPADAEPYVTINDHAGLREALGLPTERAAPDDLSDDTSEAHLGPIFESPAHFAYVSGRIGGRIGQLPGTWGVPLPNIDLLIEVRAQRQWLGSSDNGFSPITVLVGEIDHKVVADHFLAKPGWDDAEMDEHAGAPIVRWPGGDFTSLDEGDPLNPLGFPQRVAVADRTVTVTRTDEEVRRYVDTAAGRADSLADVAHWEAIAAAFDDVGAVAVMLSPHTVELNDETKAAIEDEYDQVVEDMPSLAVHGAAISPDGATQHVAVVVADEEDVEAAAEELARRTEIFIGADACPRVDDRSQLGVTVDGPVVTVSFTSEEPGSWEELTDGMVFAE